MLKDMNLKVSKKPLIIILFLGIIAWGVDDVTGMFTTLHLDNEETIAANHDANSQQFSALLNELIEDTNSSQPWKRVIAAKELGKLGNEASTAVPTLQGLLDDDASEVRTAAARALNKIETSERQ